MAVILSDITWSTKGHRLGFTLKQRQKVVYRSVYWNYLLFIGLSHNESASDLHVVSHLRTIDFSRNSSVTTAVVQVIIIEISQKMYITEKSGYKLIAHKLKQKYLL